MGGRSSTPARCSRTSSPTSGSISAASATRSCGSTARDYFENSRQATYVHQEYAIRNPHELRRLRGALLGNHRHRWPGLETRRVRGVERQFFGYIARGAPYGPDDGTVAPWVVLASLPFAPEIVIPTIEPWRS